MQYTNATSESLFSPVDPDVSTVQYRTLYSMQYTNANNESLFSPVDPDVSTVQYITLYSMQYTNANNERLFSPVDLDVRYSVCTACCTCCRPVRGESSTQKILKKNVIKNAQM